MRGEVTLAHARTTSMRVQVTTASAVRVYNRCSYITVIRDGVRETVNVGVLARRDVTGAEQLFQGVRSPIRDVRFIGRTSRLEP